MRRALLTMFFFFAGCRAEGERCDAAPLGIVACGVGLTCWSATSDLSLINQGGICLKRCTSDADCPANLHCAEMRAEWVCWD